VTINGVVRDTEILYLVSVNRSTRLRPGREAVKAKTWTRASVKPCARVPAGIPMLTCVIREGIVEQSMLGVSDMVPRQGLPIHFGWLPL
jgi:hypothetical protein